MIVAQIPPLLLALPDTPAGLCKAFQRDLVGFRSGGVEGAGRDGCSLVAAAAVEDGEGVAHDGLLWFAGDGVCGLKKLDWGCGVWIVIMIK